MWTCTSYFLITFGVVCVGSFETTRGVVALLWVYRGELDNDGELYLWPDRVM